MNSIFITDDVSVKSLKSSFNQYLDNEMINPIFLLNDIQELDNLGKYILIIEDEKHYLFTLAKFITKCDAFDSALLINDIISFERIFPKLKEEPLITSLDFVIGEVDQVFNDSSKIYNAIKQKYPNSPVIGYTNYEATDHPEFPSDTKKLIELLNSNFDSVYDKKNIDSYNAFNNIIRDKIRISVIQRENYKLKEENRKLEEKNKSYQKIVDSYPENSGKSYIIGSSMAMRKVYDELDKIRNTLIRVLLRGERGVGKDIIAQAIYEDSPYGLSSIERPFRKVNCAEFEGDPSAAMSKLFGHVKGAYTDAKTERDGEIKLANNGTLFLNEVGILPKNVQEKLLVFLETKEYSKLGSDKIEKSNVRLICATNSDLEDLMQKNIFREDFYDRINEYEIYVPNLDDRKNDIPDLVYYFINNKKLIKEKFGNSELKFSISEDALNRLKDIKFQGNIRDLKNFILKAMVESLRKNKIITETTIIELLEGREQLTEYLADAEEFLNKIAKILELDYFKDKIKVNIPDILPFFKSTKTGITNMHRVHFSSEELNPRKPYIKKLYIMYPNKWFIIKSKKLNLVSN